MPFSLLSAEPLRWRRWGEEAVVFNPASGDTHLLNLVEQAALEEVAGCGPISLDSLARRLADRLQIDDLARLETYLHALLAQFCEVGLITSESP